ncbi:MAG: MotA/TolQ/ExbB proton channel family protein [Elusimicrobiota bacterium]
MLDFIAQGGIMMYPLLISSILVVAIVINRFYFFKKIEVDEEDLYVKVKDKLRSSSPKEAIAYSEEIGGPIANILIAGLQKYGRGPEEIEEAFEREALIEIPLLEKYLPALNTIGSVSTLIGFTGTVLGMIKAFNDISQAGTTSPGIVAGGIAEALTSTATGLIIAIPALIFYHYFSHRVENIVLEVDKISRNIMDVMLEKDNV